MLFKGKASTGKPSMGQTRTADVHRATFVPRIDTALGLFDALQAVFRKVKTGGSRSRSVNVPCAGYWAAVSSQQPGSRQQSQQATGRHRQGKLPPAHVRVVVEHQPLARADADIRTGGRDNSIFHDKNRRHRCGVRLQRS